MSRNTIPLTQDIIDALTSLRNNNERLANFQNNMNFLSTRIANSSGLDVLHEYGARVQSPNWNDQNVASCLTPSNATSLNLNSVEEEDEYLYGDSNSVPEEKVSVEEVSIINNTGTEWSDEEDWNHGATSNRLNSRLTKNIDCDYQNKTQESINFPRIKRDENLIESRAHSTEIPQQKYASHKLEYEGSILSPTIQKNQFPEVSQTGVKSKYHAAAEVLKKRAVDKANVMNNNSNENLGTFPGSSKNISELNATVQDWKTDKLPVKRQTPMLNPKHVDNIRDYLTAPQRKRPFSHEEFVPEKHLRYETLRSSPSRHHSPPKSSMSNYRYSSSRKYSESDRMKYASSSRHRSPSFEAEKHHSRYSDSHRRYSPSPKRWSRSPDYRHHRRSRERSTEYSRHRDRSRRSRSRSPGYYSSRKNTYDKKTSRKSPKKSDYYSKKKEKSNYSSGDSFCSLSLDSSSDSSDSSDESSDEKKKPIKPAVKTASKDNRKREDEASNLKSSDDKRSEIPDSTLQSSDISKKVSSVFNVKESKVDSDLLDSIWNAFQPNKEQQLLMNFLEQMQPQQQPIVTPDSSTFASPAVANINIASNLQMPVIPSSESYPYPTMSAAPVQYVAPQMTNFPPIIPSATFPSPVMAAAPPPSEYGPYLPMPSVPPNDSQYITNIPKSVNVRPSTLRTIPMSDTVHIPPASSSKIEESKNIERSKIQESNNKERSKIQESKNKERSKIQNFSKSSEKKINYSKEKGAEKSATSSPKLSESTSEQNKLLIVEKFKKMKSDRAKSLYKAKSASDDLDEMRRMLDETFGKKISASEKLLYTKCKNQFNLSLDIASQANKEARRADENLNNFKSKLPTALQAEVSKIKLEQCTEEPVNNERISCLDQGDHICCDCYIHCTNVKEFLTHIQTPEHKEQMEAKPNLQKWKKDFVKEQQQDASEEPKKVSLKAVKGAEFVKPLIGFYCSLCREVLIDESSAEQHLKGHQHFVSYESLTTQKAPLYEIKRLFKRYMKMAISSRQKDVERKAERKKLLEAAEKKSKEILLKEKSKEIKFVELEEKDSEDFSPSSNQKITNIKLNLSEKDDDKSVEEKSSAKEFETKNPSKFIYIGKAPNFKKAQKPTPWYKRENILNKKLDASSSSSDVINEVEKTTKNTQSSEVKISSPTKKSEMSKEDFVGLCKRICNEDSEKRKSRFDITHSDNSSNFENKNPVTQVIKKKLNVSDSSNYKKVQLSEIALPEVSSLPSSGNANIPQPMDIDNSQDGHSKPKSEEEKDLLLLSINREDLQPLVAPVPPPTTMVSYPSLSTARTLPSNINCGTTSTSSIENTIKSFDFSKPPPNIASYQNNVPMPVYGNQNNTQNVGSYSYSANNPQIPVYSNTNQMNFQTTYQTISPFSTLPPTVYRNNPPPMLPYSNNVVSANQYPGTNNASYNAYLNPMPTNLNNQSYQQPSVYSMSPKSQTHFPVLNTLQNIVPPGSEYDSSFRSNYSVVTTSAIHVNQSKTSSSTTSSIHANQSKTSSTTSSTHVNQSKTFSTTSQIKINQNKTSTSPIKINQNKTSPISPIHVNQSKTSSLKKVGNLITIVPEKNNAEKFANDNKPTKSEVVTSNIKIQDKNKIPSSEQVNIDTKNIEKQNKTEKTTNVISSNEVTLEFSKIVGNIAARCIIDECIKNIELKELEDNDEKERIKSSSVVKVPEIYSNSVNSNYKLVKSQQMTVGDVSNITVDENTKVENDFEEPSTKITKKKICTGDMEVIDGKSVEKSSNVIFTSAGSLNKVDEVNGNGENTKVIMTGEVIEKIMVDSAHDENILKECTENATNNSMVSKQEQINTIDDIVFVDEVSNIKAENKNDSEEASIIHEKHLSVESLKFGDGTNLEKSSNIICSLAGSLNKMEEVDGDRENTKVLMTININENVTEGNTYDSKVIVKENVENATNDSVFSKQEQINVNDEIKDIVFLDEVPIIKSKINKIDSMFSKQQINANDDNDIVFIDEVSNIKIENKNYSKEQTTKVESMEYQNTTDDENDIIFVNEVSNIKVKNNSQGEMTAESMEIEDNNEKSSDIVCSFSGNSNKTDEVAKIGENTDVVAVGKKIMEDCAHDSEDILQTSIENITNDPLFSVKHTENDANDNIVFEKSPVECCFSAENSSNTINGKNEDLELSSVSITIEEKNYSYSDKCMQDENDYFNENSINKKSLENIHVPPTSINKTLEEASHITIGNKNDSVKTTEKFTEFFPPVENACNKINKKNDEEMMNLSAIVEDDDNDDLSHDTKVLNEDIKNYVTLSDFKERILEENKKILQSSDVSNYTEISKLKHKEEISHQDLKDNINAILKPEFDDQSPSVLSKVNEKEIYDKKIWETESKELHASVNIIVKEENNLTFAEKVKCENISKLMENLEESEVSISDKVIIESMNKSEDVLQDAHLKLDKNSEDKKNSDCEAKTTLESGYHGVLENKMEAPVESVTAENEETAECAMELSDISCTDPKDSSDTEEYED